MQELDLLEVIRIILKNRWLVIAIVSVAAVAAVTYSLLTPQIWGSEAAFFAVSSKQMDFSLSIASMGKLAGDLLEQNMQDEAENSIAIMKSRSFSEAVILRYNLVSYFQLDDPDSLANLDDALLKLEKIVKIDYGDKDNLILLEVETKSKSLSRSIADFYLTHLEENLKQNNMVKGRRNRIFLEKRTNELWDTIDSLQMAISAFKSKYQAVNLQQQASQLIVQYSTLMADKMKLEISLKLARANYAPASPIIKDLELQMVTIEKQIKELEHRDNDLQNKFQLDLSRIPSLTARLTLLELNLNIHRQVFDFVRPQYEQAILEEQKNLPQLEILDSPREAGRRIRPRRAMICLVTILVAGFLSVLLVVVKEIIMAQPDRLDELKDTLHAK